MKKKELKALQARNLIAETESRLADQERALLAAHRLCASDLAILARLQKRGPQLVNQIAPKVGLTSGSMTSAVQRLRKREVIATHRDENDGRKVRVQITKPGKQVLRQLTADRDQLFSPIFAALTDRENQIFSALLRKIRKASRSKK